MISHAWSSIRECRCSVLMEGQRRDAGSGRSAQQTEKPSEARLTAVLAPITDGAPAPAGASGGGLSRLPGPDALAEVIRKAIHLAWFTTTQDRMRRESAEIASDPAEREEAEQLREWARYLATALTLLGT
jgi:hypothetical protein